MEEVEEIAANAAPLNGAGYAHPSEIAIVPHLAAQRSTNKPQKHQYSMYVCIFDIIIIIIFHIILGNDRTIQVQFKR